MYLQQKTIEKIRQLINEETEYRSGPQLVKFFNNLGCNDSYGQGFPSRWVYTEDRLKNMNNTVLMEKCIKNVLSPVNFIGKFNELDDHIKSLNQYLAFDSYKIIRKGKDVNIIKSNEDIEIETESYNSEGEFLKQEFKEISIDNLNLDTFIVSIIKDRFEEIKKSLNAKSALAVIFLCGSTLEGVLLSVASANVKNFNQAKSSPKDKNGKVLNLNKWTLNSLIDVAKDTGFISEDVKKFSHSLREFRNYIHPYEQASCNFSPSEHTAKICWQVLKLAILQISDKTKKV